MSETALIAVVDDDASVRAALHALLRSLGFANATFASAEDFLSSHELQETACVIADVNMPGMSGPELNRRLIVSGTPIPVILITAYPDDTGRERALREGVVSYLTKPFKDDDLLACLHSALGRPNPGEQGV